MTEFQLWFTTGLEHITDINGYDHILFVMLLVLSFPLKEWKKLLILVTGFTIGHSISLALSVLNIVRAPQSIIEVLIALTILATAIYNALNFRSTEAKNLRVMYFFIPLFGVIHGLGFSYLLRSMLGHEQNVALPLLYFNTGLEVGQLLIVLIVVLFSLLLTRVLKCPYNYYKLTVSCIIILVTLKMSVERLLELY